MGCRVIPYWFATFVFDFIVFIITVIAFFIVAWASSISFIMEFWAEMMFAFIFFGFSFISFSYMCGFLFEKSNSALKGFPAINFFIVWCVPWSLLGIWTVID